MKLKVHGVKVNVPKEPKIELRLTSTGENSVTLDMVDGDTGEPVVRGTLLRFHILNDKLVMYRCYNVNEKYAILESTGVINPRLDAR